MKIMGFDIEDELKLYYLALALGSVGVLCGIVFFVSQSMVTMMIMGVGLFLIVLGALSLLYAIRLDYKKTGSIKEAIGLSK
ncbi:MAG: hypothetical protein BME93_03325 [Methanosarcinales archaeon Met12]|nr:MAG: hypothetical protein BME93_03325 [Methanosarcinales archaeon Met12]